MQSTRFTCGSCGQDILSVEHKGTPVPVVVYMVAGVHPDVADVTDVNAIPLPRVVREMFNLPVARMDWCVPCLASALGHPLVLPDVLEDTAAGEHQRRLSGLPPGQMLSRADRDVAERARVVKAFKAKGKAIDRTARAGRRRSAAKGEGS